MVCYGISEVVNSARKLAYSHAGVLVKIAYSVQNSARTPLFCSNSARYPKTFSAPRAVFIFANIEGNLGLTP